MTDHSHFMRQAIEIARGNPARPFGALLVDSRGQILSSAANDHDASPLWHGELLAIHQHASQAHTIDYSELTLYTTAEPCCMCMGAILWCGIGTVVYGTSIRSLIQFGWKQIDIPCREVFARADLGPCQVVGGILEAECDALFRAAQRAVSS